MNPKNFIIPKSLYVLLCVTLILLGGRVLLFHSHYYDYLAWNIFLAMIPFFISSIMMAFLKKNIHSKLFYLFLGVIWLFFFPNAPYIVTDILHLGKIPSSPILYDTFLLFSSAWLGLLLGFHSLLHIEKILEHFYTTRIRNMVVLLILIVTSIGVYVGRFLRFNSWDTLTNPLRILARLSNIVSDTKDSHEFYIFTGITLIFLCFSYYSWKIDTTRTY